MTQAIVHSALYEGWVRHRRLHDAVHEFRYDHALLYLDIDELPTVFGQHWFTGLERPALASWKRRHFLHPNTLPLREAVDHHLQASLGRTSAGPIRMLTSPGLFGLCFNPVSFYYCFDASGERVDAILAEITNTPWDERHTYVIDAAHCEVAGHVGVFRTRFDKAFHVSPFHPMHHRYTWTFTAPDAALRIHMDNHDDGEKRFDASLVLERRDLTPDTWRRYVFRRWPVSWHTLAGIYWQAARLWLKGAPFHDHPDTRSSP